METQLGVFEELTEPLPDGTSIPINISPYSFTEGEDTRTYPELTRRERVFLIGELMKQTNTDPKRLHTITRYSFDTPHGKAGVKVFETGMRDEGMYLQIVNYPDGETEFLITRYDFRLK